MRDLNISIGNSRSATTWIKTSVQWEEFLERLKKPVTSSETIAEYMKLSKAEQDDLKDVGGFVGGTFTGSRRKVTDVDGRDLITLDLDNIPGPDGEAIIIRVRLLGYAAAIYSTRKHTPDRPRLRVILPMDRTLTPDEYEPVARKVASWIGMGYCDPTTFETNRLMFWPSACSDSEYVFENIEGQPCPADKVLGSYNDWKDVGEWPVIPGTEAAQKRKVARQKDPEEKTGLIGAFCRTYDIPAAMDHFLAGLYEPTDKEGRYTYTGGSTTGGAVLYENGKFLYSHHATDPCSGQLVNAFDLVRLHRFSQLDEEAKPGTPVNRLPSFQAMEKEALEDKKVAHLLAKERRETAKDVFASDLPEAPEAEGDWHEKLTVDSSGNYRKTINNLVLILQNDPMLKDKIVTDEFAGCGLVMGAVPWNTAEEKRRWTDTDDAGAQWYVETYYGISTKDKLISALAIVGGQNTINEVRDYLKSLEWDGQKRVDTLLIDYLGAEDNTYVRAVMRKSLCAAVARAIRGGVKYDYMPIFTGPQGLGKSTFLATLGKDWFSDSLTSFEGKEAAEMIQGTWINEIGELTAMTKYETAAVKQFLSKRKDIYRAAYGRRTEEHPRRCVFFGTSNDIEFLKDMTGNRRFWPVDVGINDPVKSVWEDLPGEVDQIWAEAYGYWRLGEKLYMTGKLEKLATQAQEVHRESSVKEGIIRDFLERKVPEDWDKMSLESRRLFLAGRLPLKNGIKLVPIDKICAAEIWAEAFNGDPKYLKKTDSMEINSILGQLEGWRKNKSVRRFGPYGTQRGFEKT